MIASFTRLFTNSTSACREKMRRQPLSGDRCDSLGRMRSLATRSGPCPTADTAAAPTSRPSTGSIATATPPISQCRLFITS